MSLCLLPWQYGGLCLQSTIQLVDAGPLSPGEGTPPGWAETDHRCQVVKLKILSDVNTQAAGARRTGWGGGRQAGSGVLLSYWGGAVGTAVWWVTLGA